MRRVIGTPFSGFLADDQRPLVFVRYRENRVAAGGHMRAADHQVSRGNKSRSLIRSCAPDFAIRFMFTKYLAAFYSRAGIVHGYRLALAKAERRLGRRARALALVHLRRTEHRH